MNERIKQLAKDAELDWHKHWSDDESNRLEKFAELIVRECVQTLINKTPVRYINESTEEDWEEDWDEGYDRAMKDCVHHIQEHFGVRE